MLDLFTRDLGTKRIGGKTTMKKGTESRFFHWVLVILILLFFAIPICSLAVTEPVSSWPKCSSSFLYNFFLK
jgi:hypothetical protein